MSILNIVIPVYNEAGGIGNTISQVKDVLGGISTDTDELQYTLLVVDDGSSDETGNIVRRLADEDPHIHLISLSRNFGKEGAIHAGLSYAKGDVVIVMDGDLQHPPALIPQMLELWRKGLSVVEAVRRDRGQESMNDSLFANGFYRLFSRLSGLDIRNHSDFKLLDREVVDAWLALPERERFFRGLVAWLGFPTSQIYFDTPERTEGGRQFGFLKRLRLSLTAITAFSSLPLQLVSVMGFLYLLIGSVIGSIAFYQWLSGTAVSGFTTTILLILITGGLILGGLGLIGLYIARIYEETKGRPAFRVNQSDSRLPPE